MHKKSWAGPRPGPRPFWALAPGFPGPEYAQECCACTRDLLCIHKSSFCVYTINVSMIMTLIMINNTPGASPPARPPAVFSFLKVSKNLVMRIYKKKYIYVFFSEN